MNKIINLFKTLGILTLIAFFGFYFYKIYYSNYPVKEARLEDVRKEASFLNLKESVILELKDKIIYDSIKDVDKEELGKEKLFEGINKKDYKF